MLQAALSRLDSYDRQKVCPTIQGQDDTAPIQKHKDMLNVMASFRCLGWSSKWRRRAQAALRNANEDQEQFKAVWKFWAKKEFNAGGRNKGSTAAGCWDGTSPILKAVIEVNSFVATKSIHGALLPLESVTCWRKVAT